jgi:UDP-glucose 4-epimerase
VRILVTGGAGFIGSHVVEALLTRGDEVVVVDDLSSGRREHVPAAAELLVADVRESLVDSAAGAGAIVHLAAQADVRVSVTDPARDAAVNVVGTVRVLEAARAHGAHVVFASTGGAIYGECAAQASEDDPCRPLSPYGAAKLAGEVYLAAFDRLTGSHHVALRLGNVYGPRQDPHGEAGVVAIFLGRLRAGQECLVFGDGAQERDYVYVGDVVRAVLAALAADAPAVYNVGTGRATSVLDLYAACRQAAGRGGDPVFAPARDGELQRSVLDPGRAARALGVSAETPLADGIAATWRWLSAAGKE